MNTDAVDIRDLIINAVNRLREIEHIIFSLADEVKKLSTDINNCKEGEKK